MSMPELRYQTGFGNEFETEAIGGVPNEIRVVRRGIEFRVELPKGQGRGRVEGAPEAV